MPFHSWFAIPEVQQSEVETEGFCKRAAVWSLLGFVSIIDKLAGAPEYFLLAE